MLRVMLTGASGFVGSALLKRLIADGYVCTVAAKFGRGRYPSDVTVKAIDSLDRQVDWSELVNGQETVVHCAARVHIMNDAASDPLAEFRRVNVTGTLRLAEEAARYGVKRFIFISSIKVNGESTQPGCSFSADDVPAPCDAYGISKMEAEQGLRQLSAETGMAVVIIRPVLIYGPGVKSNFRRMMAWLYRGVPLPLGSIDNRRSLVALDNLVDLVSICMIHPRAANQTFLISDGEDLSTPDLLIRMGKALNKPARLLSVPTYVLEFLAILFRRAAIAQRLCGSLQVDISKTCTLLDWKPPCSVDAALAETAKNFKNNVDVD
ncbi:MAG: NAD-dependent dehydratase [Pseudomonas sp.]|nr:NAD-dependent dehydratase [Pseudomonas sp.]